MSKLPPFRTGNVIRDPGKHGSLWIITAVHDYGDQPTVQAVSFDSENCSATQLLNDHERERVCACCHDFTTTPELDCETCHGTGRYMEKIDGWGRSEVLAPNVQEFILRAVKKQFGMFRG